MAHYAVEPTDKILEWLTVTADSERRDALLTWVGTAGYQPTLLVTGTITNSERPQHTVYFLDLPKACTRIVFQVFELPARCVKIVDIDDDAYQA